MIVKSLIYTCGVLLWSLYSLGQTETTSSFTFPSCDIFDPQGNQVSSDQITNDQQPILVIIWATWCHHSLDGMNSIMEDYYDDWQEQYGLKIVAISVDDSRNTQKVVPLYNGNGWEYELYLDPNADLKRKLGVTAAPHLFVLNGDRRIIWQQNSMNPGDEDKIAGVLEEHFAQK
ncbi:TlpA family protein disulfide reductase [bacterium SCSIO 12741]|nr:TlpA family protein disulfide reductase [bacterium SCSIO 12741]